MPAKPLGGGDAPGTPRLAQLSRSMRLWRAAAPGDVVTAPDTVPANPRTPSLGPGCGGEAVPGEECPPELRRDTAPDTGEPEALCAPWPPEPGEPPSDVRAGLPGRVPRRCEAPPGTGELSRPGVGGVEAEPGGAQKLVERLGKTPPRGGLPLGLPGGEQGGVLRPVTPVLPKPPPTGGVQRASVTPRMGGGEGGANCGCCGEEPGPCPSETTLPRVSRAELLEMPASNTRCEGQNPMPGAAPPPLPPRGATELPGVGACGRGTGGAACPENEPRGDPCRGDPCREDPCRGPPGGNSG